MSTESSQSLHTETSRITHIHRLRAMRAVWVVAVTTVVGMFIFSLPAEYIIFRDSPMWAVGYAPILVQLSISHALFASYITTLDIIIVTVSILVGILVFWKRPDDWVALLVSATVIIYACNLTLAFYLTSPILGESIRNIVPLLIVTVLFLFPNGQFISRWTQWIWLLLAGITFLDGALLLMTGSYIGLNLIGYPLGMLGLLSRYRNPNMLTTHRQQVKWLLWGVIIGFFAVANYYLIPTLFPTLASIDSPSPVYTLSSLIAFLVTNTLRLLSAIIFVSSISLSIIRYRLWDIDLTINRSLVFGLVTFALLIVFTLSIFIIQALLGAENTVAAFVISAVGPLLLFNPTRKRAQHVIDRQLYGLRFDLNQLNAAQSPPDIQNPGLYTGRKLGNYETLGVLGKGGMGEVYKGFGNGHTVAIKVLPDDLAVQAEFRQRFEREAETLTILNHPHIVKMIEAGTSAGLAYLVMEFVDGEELGHKLKQTGRFPLDDTRDILGGLAEALSYAHQQGFVHRDLKPSNVMLRRRENGKSEAVLMDFGIAKMQDVRTGLTGTGAIGTIDYMAPEQIMAAREVDHRADIYALGVLTYEMLTGERPFKGNAAQVMFAHLQQPASDPRDIVPDIPRNVARAILRAMEKHVDLRFQSAREFIKEFENSG